MANPQAANRGLAARRAHHYDPLAASSLLSIQHLPNHGIRLQNGSTERKLRNMTKMMMNPFALMHQVSWIVCLIVGLS
jgi:hypothetical protein